jgi:hypothetical protein
MPHIAVLSTLLLFPVRLAIHSASHMGGSPPPMDSLVPDALSRTTM